MTGKLGIHDKTFLQELILSFFTLGEEFEAYIKFYLDV